MGLPYWAGVVPVRQVARAPEPDHGVSGPVPAHVGDWEPGPGRR